MVSALPLVWSRQSKRLLVWSPLVLWIPVQGFMEGSPGEVGLVPATANLGSLTFAVLLWMLGTREWDQGMQQAPA